MRAEFLEYKYSGAASSSISIKLCFSVPVGSFELWIAGAISLFMLKSTPMKRFGRLQSEIRNDTMTFLIGPDQYRG